MKPRNATVLSIGAVVVASAAAIVINTSIFSGTTALADTAATNTASTNSVVADTVPTGGTPAASTQLPALQSLPATGVAARDIPRRCLPAREVTMTAAAATTFDVPNVGTVTISRDGELLRLDEVTTMAGFNADVKCAAGRLIDVEFESRNGDYDFRARVVNGEILTDVSTHDFPQPGVAGAGSPRAERRDHDDDDYEDHDDDHDDDHHDDDDDREEHDDDDD